MLKAAQWLYENKLISYPRTDSRYLGNDMKSQIPGILADLKPLKPVEIGKLNLQALDFTGRIINDAKVSDHHAIIPTGKRPGELAPAAQKVFDAVVTRLDRRLLPRLRQGSDDRRCKFPTKYRSGPGAFAWSIPDGRSFIRARWTTEGRKDDDQELADFRPGESGPHEPFVRRGETTPPRAYTEGSLLGAMETAGKLVVEAQLKEALKERGLGTPATRARSLRPCWIVATSRATRNHWPRPIWAATSWPSSETGA